MSRPYAGLARVDQDPEGGGFCRISLLAPGVRMDLALPTDLTVAELVPMLRELADQARGGRRPPARSVPLVPGDAGPTAWCLAAAAGAELPAEATLAELGVLDGDLLRLRRCSDAPPPPVFDDPGDALAQAVAEPDDAPGGSPGWPDARAARPDGHAQPLSLRPWTARCRRPAALATSALVAVAVAVLLTAVRGLGAAPHPVAAVLAGLASGAALAGAVRAAGTDGAASVVLATGAVPLASASGFAALPGSPGAGHLLLAAALASAAGSAGLALLGSAAPVLVGTVLASTLAALVALLGVFGAASPSGLAAGAATAALAMLPLLPRASVRLAGLPPPVVPTTPEELVAAEARWQLTSAEQLSHRSRLAHTYLAGLVLGAVAVAAAGAVVAATGGRWGQLFATVVAAVLLLRSRCYVTAATALAPLVGGLLTALVLIADVARTGSDLARLLAVPALLAGGGAALACCAADAAHPGRVPSAGREASPVLRRAVDVVEAALVVATFPLALAVLDLYQLVREL